MLKLTQEMFGAEDPAVAWMREDQAIMEVIFDFMNYFETLTADRRSHPTDDLATVIARAHIDGKPLPDMDTFGYYLIIATAGHDTTSSVIGGALLALLDHPEQSAASRKSRPNVPSYRRVYPLRRSGQALHAYMPRTVHSSRRDVPSRGPRPALLRLRHT